MITSCKNKCCPEKEGRIGKWCVLTFAQLHPCFERMGVFVVPFHFGSQFPLQPLLGSSRNAPQRDDPNNGCEGD